MTLRVSFGLVGKPGQWFLPGMPVWLLPPGPPGGESPSPWSLTGGPFFPPWEEPFFFGGLVEASTSGGTAHSFDVVGGWNSVKNAFAQSDQAEELRFDGFVHVDIHVGRGDPGGDSLVTVIGAKRGNIVTGEGDDIIRVELLSNEATWSTEFRIVTGGGDDVVVLAGLDRDRELAAGDMTYASFANSAKGTWNTSGEGMRSIVDLGSGNDRFMGHGSDDTVTGGAGNDLADGGAGTDTWVLSGLRGGYGMAYADGRWLITDTDLTDGNDGRDDIGGFERLRFGDGSEMALPPLPQGLVLWNRLGTAAEIATSEIGPAGTLAGGSFVPGVFGGAWRATGADASLYYQRPPGIDGVGFPSSVINAPSGTIEFWARLEGFSGWIASTGTMPGLVATVPVQDSETGPGGTWVLAFTANDGGGGYGLSGQAGDRNFTATNATFTPTYEGILGGDAAGWHHYAFAWNAEGFAELGQPEREVMLFLDGVPVSSHWEERVAWGTGYGTGELILPLGEVLALAIDGPAWPAGTAVAFDNLKVWSVAKTDFSDRFDEDAGAAEPTDTAPLTFDDLSRGVGGFRIIAEGEFDDAGFAIAPIDDLNGDGRAEILVGAINSGPFIGSAYVVWGKSDGTPVSLADVAEGEGGFKILRGDFPLGRLGWAVGSIDDRNADGLSEIMLGLIDSRGSAFVIWGKGDTEAVNLSEALSGDGGFLAFVGGELDYAGFSIGAIDDLGADGQQELIITLWPNLEDAPPAGTVRVIGDGGFSVIGSEEGEAIEFRTTVPDLDGDGLDELLLNSTRGGFVAHGRSDGADVTTDDLRSGLGGFAIGGASFRDVGASDDLNGDGLAEILISGHGMSYVVFGKSGTTAVDVGTISQGLGGFAVIGASHLQSLGVDLDQDGHPELLASDTETTYVLRSKSDGAAIDLADMRAGIDGFTVFGEGLDPLHLSRITVGDDMNGDGLPEIIFGRPYDVPGGSVYVLMSSSAWFDAL